MVGVIGQDGSEPLAGQHSLTLNLSSRPRSCAGRSVRLAAERQQRPQSSIGLQQQAVGRRVLTLVRHVASR